MNADTFTLSRPDGATIHAYRWVPDGEPAAIVQIAHGMAEHAGRYERFARALTEAGYVVYAEDHRGHGRTGRAATLGHFAPSTLMNKPGFGSYNAASSRRAPTSTGCPATRRRSTSTSRTRCADSSARQGSTSICWAA